jgi:hypothetical protein
MCFPVRWQLATTLSEAHNLHRSLTDDRHCEIFGVGHLAYLIFKKLAGPEAGRYGCRHHEEA